MYSLFEYPGAGYSLADEAFTDDMLGYTKLNTILRLSRSLDDWWVTKEDNPHLSWAELIDLSLRILHAPITRVFVQNLYLENIPDYTVKDVKLLENYVGGAKRVNFRRGEFYNFSGAVGVEGLFNPKAKEILMNPPKDSSYDKWRGHGKDDSCCVEGNWYHWCCLACNVLASGNTSLCCPELYEPALSNDNY